MLYIVPHLVIFITTALYHLKHYHFPSVQRLVLRILLLIPTYSILGAIQLYHPNESLNTIREIYEALVLFYYFRFIIYCLGNEREVVHLLLIKATGQIDGIPGESDSITIYNDSVVLMSDVITQQLLRIKSAVYQYCLCMPLISLLRFLGFEWFFLIVQNISIIYCLQHLAIFLKKVHFVHHNYTNLFLVLKSLVGLLFWQRMIIQWLPASIIQSATASLGVANDSLSLCAFISLIEYFIYALIFFFIFHPSRLQEMILVHFEQTEENHYHKIQWPFLNTRFPIRMAIRDAIGFKDVLLDLQSVQTVYNNREYSPQEALIHNSTTNIKPSVSVPHVPHMTHYESDYTLAEEDQSTLTQFNRPKRQQLTYEDNEEVLYRYAKQIGGYGYHVVEDGHVEL